MAISEVELDDVVSAWKVYAEASPGKIQPKDLLSGRDINMYRGLGHSNPHDLCVALVGDRSTATLEMTMGYLYERVLEQLGLRKITVQEKKQVGFKGIDFLQEMGNRLRVINLKAGLSTANSDITSSTLANLKEAHEFWLNRRPADDNPLQHPVRRIELIRAVARGPEKDVTTPDGVRWLVGESMWSFFGAGEMLAPRLGDALTRNPLDYDRFQAQKQAAVDRVFAYLVDQGLATIDNEIRWAELIEAFP